MTRRVELRSSMGRHVETVDDGLGQHLSADPRIATADGRTEVLEP